MASKLILFLCLLVCGGFALKLEQVLILSRHNLRHPLSENLNQYTSHSWPVSNYETGYLTPKGKVLEIYMGEYISHWLKTKKLLPEDCIDLDKNVFIYANTKQRTRETARAFVDGAFNNCNVSIYSIDSTEMDPVFNPIFRTDSDILKDIIIHEMEVTLRSLDLKSVYSELDKILDIKNSDICKKHMFCSLTKSTDEVIYKINEEPDVSGPLNYSNSIVDALLMMYYEGTDLENIAWGQIKTEMQWKLLGKITQAHQKVRFRSHNLAKEVAKPLLNYIYNTLFTNTKLVLLVGHDSNIESVIGALDFENYVLPEQNELTPIGGKLVFQKWLDENTNKHLVKIDYVYATTDQIRNGIHLSEENPPQWVEMKLGSCNTDENGFCSWDRFMEVVKDSI